MNFNAIEAGYSVYQSSQPGKGDKASKSNVTDVTSQSDSDTEVAATYERSSDSATRSASGSTKNSSKSSSTKSSDKSVEKGIYSNTRTSSNDRSMIIAQMKADTEQRMANMQSLVTSMFKKQGITIGTADDMWKVLASGKFTADPATIAQAKEDISDDGYWGVSQTSDRIVSFAIALSGGDEGKMKEMVSAVQKGFKQATKAWGKELPDISNQTYGAVMDKFDNWFKENNSDATTDDILNNK